MSTTGFGVSTLYCENGWPVTEPSNTEVIRVGGRSFRLRRGDVAYTFKRFLERYVKEIESIDDGPLDDWSFIIRNVRDSKKKISNHAGYAIDVNAVKHQRGIANTFTRSQLNALRRLLQDFWVIGWGGDYKESPVDDMHFEIKKGVSERVLASFVNSLKHNTPVGPSANVHNVSRPVNINVKPAVRITVRAPVERAPKFPLPRGYYFGPKEGPRNSISGYFSHSDDLKMWQERMLRRGWKGIGRVDGLYGPKTRAVVLAFQKDKRLTRDGKIGPVTWRATWESPVT